MTCVSCANSSQRTPTSGVGSSRAEASDNLRRSATGGPLAATQNQYDPIAELYDGYPGNYLEDVLFFAEEARAAGSPILEIGVGTGRLALCLAAIGLEVVGIDSSPAMLRVLGRNRAGHPELPGRVLAVAADMRAFALRRRFPLAIIPFRAFLYLLTAADRRRALRAVCRHLAPGGKLIMSFFVPPADLLDKGRLARQEMARFHAPEPDGEVVAFDSTEFLPRRQQVISHITYQWRDSAGRTTREFEHTLVARYLFPAEVPPLLESCGYQVVAAYGSFAREPLAPESHEQIWIAEAI